MCPVGERCLIQEQSSFGGADASSEITYNAPVCVPVDLRERCTLDQPISRCLWAFLFLPTPLANTNPCSKFNFVSTCTCGHCVWRLHTCTVHVHVGVHVHMVEWYIMQSSQRWAACAYLLLTRCVHVNITVTDMYANVHLRGRTCMINVHTHVRRDWF